MEYVLAILLVAAVAAYLAKRHKDAKAGKEYGSGTRPGDSPGPGVPR